MGGFKFNTSAPAARKEAKYPIGATAFFNRGVARFFGRSGQSAAGSVASSYRWYRTPEEDKMNLIECGASDTESQARAACSKLSDESVAFLRETFAPNYQPPQDDRAFWQGYNARKAKRQTDDTCSKNDNDRDACYDPVHSDTGKRVCKFDKNNKCSFGPGERKAAGGLPSYSKSKCRGKSLKNNETACEKDGTGCYWDEDKGCRKVRASIGLDHSAVVSAASRRGESKSNQYDDNVDSDGDNYDEEDSPKYRPSPKSINVFDRARNQFGGSSPMNSRAWTSGSPTNSRTWSAGRKATY
jgi:hypothetical protein